MSGSTLISLVALFFSAVALGITWKNSRRDDERFKHERQAELLWGESLPYDEWSTFRSYEIDVTNVDDQSATFAIH